ncbi:MAG: DUF4097 family beta strand repeat protein [Oscillospiraceae bacterium]|nr:DUF4097 family beta strand repeat protein [Oscillospiraceae bacterium]
MTKKGKIALWVALGAILLGLVLTAVGGMMVGFNLSKLGTMTFDTVSHPVEGEVERITVRDVESTVLLTPSEDDQCRVVTQDNQEIYHTVTLEEGHLTVTRIDRRAWYQKLNFWWNQSLAVEVQLPRRVYGALLLESVSGAIRVEEGFSFSEVTLTTVSGDIAFTGAVSGELQGSTTSGNLTLRSGSCEALSLFTVSGNTDLADVRAKSLSAEGTSGNLTLERVTVEETATLETVSGEIVLEESDSGSLELTTVSGNVTGTLLTGKTFRTETVSGRITVPENDSAGGQCRISTVSGNVSLSLAK